MTLISESETAVMDALWRSAEPLSADDVIERIGDAQGWSPATVKTFLNRLLKKNAIVAEQRGKRYFYRPLLQQSVHVQAESRTLLDRFFDGRLAPFVAHFSKHERLSSDELAELRRLIDELDSG